MNILSNLFPFRLFRVFEHGLQHRENSRVYTKKPTCTGTGGKFISVGFYDVQPALLLLCWGFGMAVTTFFMELLVKTHKQRRRLMPQPH